MKRRRALWFSLFVLVFVSFLREPERTPNAHATEKAGPERELGEIAQECRGCHTQARSRPKGRFAIGLGMWEEMQCFGCHAEVEQIAREVADGREDRRELGLPVSRERLFFLADHRLSYLDAPEEILFSVSGIARIAPERLGAFLRRPARRGDRWMMAFPEISDEEARELPVLLSERAEGTRDRSVVADRRRAEEVFGAVCVACHGSASGKAGRGADFLSMFTETWIYAYVNGKVKIPGRSREMPVLSIDRATAAGLYEIFAEMRRRNEASLDERVRALPVMKRGESTRNKLSEAAIQYIWKRALRDGRCVHCHLGNTRAAGHFEASEEGLRTYVGRRGGDAIWRRLKIRRLEEETGLSAAAPGMPMTVSALPEEFYQLFRRWAESGCPTPKGEPLCERRSDGGEEKGGEEKGGGD